MLDGIDPENSLPKRSKFTSSLQSSMPLGNSPMSPMFLWQFLPDSWLGLTLMGHILPGPIKNRVGFRFFFFKKKKNGIGLGQVRIFTKTRPEPGPDPVTKEIGNYLNTLIYIVINQP